jgi:hypothetical protein
MGAKQKLNSASFMGAFLFAGILGLLTNSLAVFLLAGVALLVAGSARKWAVRQRPARARPAEGCCGQSLDAKSNGREPPLLGFSLESE